MGMGMEGCSVEREKGLCQPRRWVSHPERRMRVCNLNPYRAGSHWHRFASAPYLNSAVGGVPVRESPPLRTASGFGKVPLSAARRLPVTLRNDVSFKVAKSTFQNVAKLSFRTVAK